MTGMLRADDITVQLGAETIALRPTLRAATRLHRRHGGFATLAQAIADQSLTAMCDVLSDHVHFDGMGITRSRVWGARHDLPGPLLAYLAALVGTEERDTGDSDKPGTPFDDYFDQLFRLGTGWLGWTPEATWDAAPAEIAAAYEGRLDMLATLFGGKKDTAPSIPWDQKFRAFAAGRARKAA